jgi:autoinducer 2-degrading protein
MHVVHVFVLVKPDRVEDFKAATRENALESLKEPGVARFDMIQQKDDPSRFVLVEVYRKPEDAARHKETQHYEQWRDAVADMAAPRSSIRYRSVFPAEDGWD